MVLDELLLEGQNYDGMINQLLGLIEDEATRDRYAAAFKKEIDWAREKLKRKDRVTWWLRIARAYLASDLLDDSTTYYGEGTEYTINGEARERLEKIEGRWYKEVGFNMMGGMKRSADRRLDRFSWRDRLEHFMGTPSEEIQNLVFNRQKPEDLFRKLEELEAKWRAERTGFVKPDPTDEILIDFKDGWAWYKLDRSECSDEADAMGHCGNQFGIETDRILSLRRTMKNGLRPSLTFIVDQDGYLGEMKGRENNKPKEKYHAYIAALLKHPSIVGIKGGGYEPENNFALADLTPEERAAVYESKPTMLTCSDYLSRHGVDETLGKMMSKTFEGIDPDIDQHPLGLVQKPEGYVFAVLKTQDWVGTLRELGEKSIGEVIDEDIHQYLGHDGNDEHLRGIVNGFPEAMIEKIMEYIAAECPEVDDEFGDDWFDEYDWDAVLDWIQQHEPRSIHNDLTTYLYWADSEGYTEGSQQAVTNALKKEAQTGFGREFQLDTEDHDGDYYLWCSVEHWISLLENPKSALHAEHNLALGIEAENPWDERPSLSTSMENYIEFDDEACLRYFNEYGPEECRIEIPTLKPIAEMSDEEIRAELRQLGKDDEWMERYYGGHFSKNIGDGLKRTRERYYGVSENIAESITEAHHALDHDHDDFLPLRAGDTVEVFHGFREPADALRVAHVGISGAEKVGRVYSYEADNNPKGLFVTVSRDIAERFVGAYGTRTIMQFTAKLADLQPPVWPSGQYTVQGGYSQYFGHGQEGRRNRSAARREMTAGVMDTTPYDHVKASDDPLLASLLTVSGERQALFVGHLNPQDIDYFWVEHERDDWVQYTVEQYISEFGETENHYLNDYHNKVFQAGETFNGDKFLREMKKFGGEDVEDTLKSLWFQVLGTEQKRRAATFHSFFSQFLWPKQIIPAMQWMRDRFGRN